MTKDWTKEDNLDDFKSGRQERCLQRIMSRLVRMTTHSSSKPPVGKFVDRYTSEKEREILSKGKSDSFTKKSWWTF